MAVRELMSARMLLSPKDKVGGACGIAPGTEKLSHVEFGVLRRPVRLSLRIPRRAVTLHDTVERIRPSLRKTQSEKVWRVPSQHHLEALLSGPGLTGTATRSLETVTFMTPNSCVVLCRCTVRPVVLYLSSLQYRPSTYMRMRPVLFRKRF